MEEEKAAAYYDELTRKGGGAARFKQGLGFSSQSSDIKTDNAPARGSALPSSSSFLSSFVRASSPGKTSLFEKQAQLESIQNKLKKKQSSDHESRVLDHSSRDDSRSRRRSSSGERERNSRKRSRSRDGRDSRRRFRSSSRERERDRRSERRRRSRSRSGSYSDEERLDRERKSSRRRRRSRSRSYSDEERKRSRGSREGKERGRRSRSSSPREPKSEKSRSDRYGDRSKSKSSEKNGDIDYSRLINGYAEMVSVRTKMTSLTGYLFAFEFWVYKGNKVGSCHHGVHCKSKIIMV